MPCLDGAEATKRIIKHLKDVGKNPESIPVIGLSAYTDKQSMDYCMSSGMIAYTNKPIKKNVILDILKHHKIYE